MPGSAMRLFVLTGAGVSAESGMGTFRDKGGIWERFDPMKLATPSAFARDPRAVHEFYNMRRRNLLAAQPNPAHRALARLEAELAALGGRMTLVTQNIDDLHERAGSRRVVHMHGELLKARCTSCGAVAAWKGDMGIGDSCPSCGKAGNLRPDVVWFEEMPMFMTEIGASLREATLFAAIGTSGSVYPAAGFADTARRCGVPACEINLEPSDNTSLFDKRHYGLASEAVPAWADEMLKDLRQGR